MKKPVIIGVSAVVVIAVVGVGAFLLTQNKSNDTVANNTSETRAGQNTSDSLAKKYTDACDIFTKEELSAAFGGRTYGDGEEGIAFTTASPGTADYDNEDLRGSACDYDQETDSIEAMRTSLDISVKVDTYKDVSTARQFMSDIRDPQTAEGQEAVNDVAAVNGVGDEAFFVKVNAGGAEDKVESLNVRVGRQIITLDGTQLSGMDHGAVRASLTALAKKL